MTDPAQAILVVDDHPANLKLAVEQLEAYAFEVLTAREGSVAIQRAERAAPALILLDVEMPGIDGYETCRRLKANSATADIPVIFMTVRDEAQDKLRAFEAGAVDYVIKPFEVRELLARVRAHVDLRRTTLELERERSQLDERVAERTAELRQQMERSEAYQREREQLLELVRDQSEQLRHFTQRWIAEQSERDRALSRTLDEQVSQRMGQIREYLQRARDMAVSGDANGAAAKLERALAVLNPTADGAEAVRSQLGEGRISADSPFLNLSGREHEVLQLLTIGKTNKEIAFTLGLARTTVSTYRTRIMEKLGVDDLATLIKVVAGYDSGLPDASAR